MISNMIGGLAGVGAMTQTEPMGLSDSPITGTDRTKAMTNKGGTPVKF